jgi:hypothetical protein
MVHFDTAESAGERFQQRQCWLGMRAAYDAYRQASALAHSLADDLSSDPTSSDKAIQLQAATHDQRTAFEGYIEARLGFLESSCDRNNHKAAPGGLRARRFVGVVGAIAVGLSVLNILSFSWERRQIADLNTRERETNVSISEARQTLQALSDRTPPNIAASSGSSADTSQAPGASRRSRPLSSGPRRSIASLVRSRRYTYLDFAVTVSPRFTRVGAIRISVRSVDRRSQKVALCVASSTATFCKNDVRPYEWLTISLGQPLRSVDLFVSRVGPSRVQGYFRTSGSWSPLKVNAFQMR